MISKLPVLSRVISQPSLIYYYFQKGIRSIFVRERLGAIVAVLVRLLQLRRSEISPASVDAVKISHDVKMNGICFLPQLQIPEDQLNIVRSFLKNKPVYDLYSGAEFNIDGDVPLQCSKLAYRTTDLVNCQPLLQLANSPLIIEAVTDILGARPTICLFQSWWTLGEHHESVGKSYDDVYHRDVDDFRFVKIFAYLTDTHEKNGAHSYIVGSHRSSLFTRRGPISDQQVHDSFDSKNIVTITGKAGAVFLENTWGIHRPLFASEGRRLIFSALYCLTPWVPRGKNEIPAAEMPKGFDKYINRLLFK
jgi:hypothetical protein